MTTYKSVFIKCLYTNITSEIALVSRFAGIENQNFEN